MSVKRFTQTATKTYPVPLQSDGSSSQGASEPSIFSSTLHVPVSTWQEGQLSPGGSACCCFSPTWVSLSQSCTLPLKTQPTRAHWKIRRGSLLLLGEEAVFCWEMGHLFGRASGLTAHDLCSYTYHHKGPHEQNASLETNREN